MWFESLVVFILFNNNNKKRPNISGIRVVAYKITSRSLQVELGKVEGFRGNALVNAKQPFYCEAASSLAL